MNIVYAKPKISSCELINALLASLALKNKVIIDQDCITNCLYQYKQDEGCHRHLFDDIAFKVSIDNVTSDDVAKSLCAMQTFGVIGKLNPQYSKIVIYYSRPEAERVLADVDSDLKSDIDRIAQLFKN